MKIFLVIISLLSINQCQSQIKKDDLIEKSWGEINDRIAKHRGKAGLISMRLYSNHTFKAYENTDFGAAVLQSGKWNLKNGKIVFDVLKTENYAEHTIMKGKILSEKEKGKIEYYILELTNEKLILYNKKLEKRIVFEITKYGIK